ncbi:hypothetical protein [Sphingomonas sp. PP-F2F-A104-K0414]|uniref:hypothetical protein n=1 Tax=Sphingomonas sp. PP-F2F-A104-K0414 TaxID=2135661 RepID=UPI0014051B16|nr:hypothetical protein [Sphingomonas sp. PP-F2F-A104-K0414]
MSAIAARLPESSLSAFLPSQTFPKLVPFREKAQALKRQHKDHVRHAVGVG